MKNPLPVVFLAIFSVLSPCLGVPETLEMADGRKLEQVTAAVMEEGKVKVIHSGGIGRISPEDFTAESRKALGLAGGENAPAPVPKITRLETTKGEVYEGIRSVRVTPAGLSFVYRDGAASLGFDELPEETRTLFHYDPAKMAEHTKEEKEREYLQADFERQEEAKLANMAAGNEKKQTAIAKAKKQIVEYYYERIVFSSGDRAMRVSYAKRFLTSGGVVAAEQDAMIQSWLPEARIYTNAKNAEWAKKVGSPQGQLRGSPDGTRKKK